MTNAHNSKSSQLYIKQTSCLYLPQDGWAACIPVLRTGDCRLGREVGVKLYGIAWRTKAIKPGLLYRLGEGTGPAVLQALYSRENGAVTYGAAGLGSCGTVRAAWLHEDILSGTFCGTLPDI